MNRKLTESNVTQVRIMTDEEIRLRAEDYARSHEYHVIDSRYSLLTAADYLKYSYMDGAHSRDPEIEDLKSNLAKVKKEKDLLSAAFNVVQSELDRLKWHDAEVDLPPREVDGGSYSILVATSCDDSKESYYLDRYDYQAKRWMYNSNGKVLRWRIKE